MTKKATPTIEHETRTLLLGIYAPYNKVRDLDAYFEEFLNLAETANIPMEYRLFIKVRAVDKANFLTKGKLEEVLDYCSQHHIDEIICSENLSPLQERNLSDVLSCDVYDRTQLILNIFRDAAHTAEGKTQVEIAELDFLKTRLAGRGLNLAQQAGFIGTKGPGETEKEALKRYYETKVKQAQKRLNALKQSRDVQRKQRLRSNIPLVSLVGYTNAGKSSVMNKIAKSDIYAADKLFATVDPTTRNLFIAPDKKVLLSDTVGFISGLPTHLIEAFKATLEELTYANLLLHVVDLSNPVWKDQAFIVQKILNELGATAPILYLFNKIDLIEDMDTLLPELTPYQPYVLTSTINADGVDDLLAYLKTYEFKKVT